MQHLSRKHRPLICSIVSAQSLTKVHCSLFWARYPCCLQYDARCYFNFRSKADTSQLYNLPQLSRIADHCCSQARLLFSWVQTPPAQSPRLQQPPPLASISRVDVVKILEEELVEHADDKLFTNVMYNKHHVLHPTLPGTKNTKYHLRRRPHNFKL